MTPTQDATPQPTQPKSRRRRFILGALLATLGLGVAARMAVGSPPCDGGHGRWRHPDPAAMKQHMQERLQHVLEKVNASQDQQTRILAIMDQTFTDLEPYRAQRETAHQQARDLLSQANIDPAAVEALRAAQVQSFDAVSKRITQALLDAAAVLTPEQRTALAENLAKHHGPGPF